MEVKTYIKEHKTWFIAAGVALGILFIIAILFGANSSLFRGTLNLNFTNLTPETTEGTPESTEPVELTPIADEITNLDLSDELGLLLDDGVDEPGIPTDDETTLTDEQEIPEQDPQQEVILARDPNSINNQFTLGQVSQELQEIIENQEPLEIQTNGFGTDFSVSFDNQDDLGVLERQAPEKVIFPEADNEQQIDRETVDRATAVVEGAVVDEVQPVDDQQSAANQPPSAVNLRILGADLGLSSFVASYQYFDAENDVEGNSILEWYSVVPKSSFTESIEELWNSLMTDEDPEALIDYASVGSFFVDDPELINDSSETINFTTNTNKYIFFRYKPISQTDPTDGRFYYSKLALVEPAQVANNSQTVESDGEQIVEPTANTQPENTENAGETKQNEQQGTIIIGNQAVPATNNDEDIIITSNNQPSEQTSNEQIVITSNSNQTNFNLSSNTNANLLAAAGVQGDTGPQALIVLPFLASLSVLAGRRFAKKD